MKANTGIDLLKFICSIMVVTIHVEPFKDVNPHINNLLCNFIARIAVPIFFVCVGYFLFRNEKNFSNIKEYCINIFQKYTIWTLIYFPIIFYENFIKMNTSITKNFIRIIQKFFIAGSFLQLWFLPATIIAVLLVYILKKNLFLGGGACTGIIFYRSFR